MYILQAGRTKHKRILGLWVFLGGGGGGPAQTSLEALGSIVALVTSMGFGGNIMLDLQEGSPPPKKKKNRGHYNITAPVNRSPRGSRCWGRARGLVALASALRLVIRVLGCRVWGLGFRI